MAKKEKTQKAVAAAANRSAKSLTRGAATVLEHSITRRAYDLYVARDRRHGHDVEDWLQAEREHRAGSDHGVSR